jgi:hypothetical protein
MKTATDRNKTIGLGKCSGSEEVSPYCKEMFQVRAMIYAGINFQELQVTHDLFS